MPSGYDFEIFCGKLLEFNGFVDVRITGTSNDYGVDIIAFKEDVKYAIQCKKYSHPIGVSAVQEVIASKSMHDCHVAVVLTNSTFTTNAEVLAKKNNVLLWDRHKLINMLKHN